MEPVDTKSEPAPKTMRSHWFEHVAKTRKKLSKGQKKTGFASRIHACGVNHMAWDKNQAGEKNQTRRKEA